MAGRIGFFQSTNFNWWSTAFCNCRITIQGMFYKTTYISAILSLLLFCLVSTANSADTSPFGQSGYQACRNTDKDVSGGFGGTNWLDGYIPGRWDCTPRCQECARRVELANSIVPVIRNKQVTCGIENKPGWTVQMRGYFVNVCPRRIIFTDCIVSVSDVKVATGIKSQAAWSIYIRADSAYVCTRRIELAYSRVDVVCSVKITSRIECQPFRPIQIWCDITDEYPRRVELADVEVIRYIEVACRIKGKTFRATKIRRNPADIWIWSIVFAYGTTVIVCCVEVTWGIECQTHRKKIGVGKSNSKCVTDVARCVIRDDIAIV